MYDETAKDKAKFEIQAERHKTNNRELQNKAAEKTTKADRLERAVGALETQLADAKLRMRLLMRINCPRS